MVLNPTLFARTTRSSTGWPDAKSRVIHAYREWLRAVRDIPRLTMTPDHDAPEIQTMYSLNMPVARLRTKMRQEFERHRYVAQLATVDVLISKSQMEFQETMNYWKQLNHVLKYFAVEENPNVRLPTNFIEGFLEGRN